MRKSELVRRYLLFIVSLFFCGLGVAFTKRGELGVSPVSSVANIMSYKFPALSMGNWLIVWNCVLIVGEVLILRKRFQPIQFLQVPLSFVFGWFTDLGMLLVSLIPVESYLSRLAMLIIGIVILGFGISLSLIANVIMNAGEAFVKAVADTANKNFGNVKIAFDIFNVVLSILLSLLFFEFTIVGTREGTVISALFTGAFVKFFVKVLRRPVLSMLIPADK